MIHFWEHKTLTEMTPGEWESLCDGCGQCCLHKLVNEETTDVFYTHVACRLLDTETARCQALCDADVKQSATVSMFAAWTHQSSPGCLEAARTGG